MNERSIRVTIESIERLPSSRNGNPRYLVHTADGEVYRTNPDSALAYDLPGDVGKTVQAVVGERYFKPVIYSYEEE